jgi:hypothetical protein
MAGKARSALFLGWAALACGPSLATVHEGAVRFEHCYGIDLDEHSSPMQRKACWQLWVTSYTVGQPRDRIEYAERRLHALAGDDDDCPRLALSGEHRAENRQFYLVVPAPTSVHTPPPPIATVVRDPARDPSDAGAEPSLTKAAGGAPGTGAKAAKTEPDTEPPSASCATGCRDDWENCNATCTADVRTQKCAQCKTDYAKCMRGCFE